MKVIFYEQFHLENIIIYTQNEDYKEFSEFKNIFDDISIFEDFKDFKILKKNKIINPLLIRQAIEEDQDNLAQICNEQTEMKTEVFGEFFLAEIISSNSQDKICLVAENEDKKAVGLLVASKEVNYNLIFKNYNLDYHRYFIKDDFYNQYNEYQNAKLKIEKITNQFELEKNDRIKAFYKNIHSKTFLIIQLQEFCVQIKDDIQKLFDQFQNLYENKKILQKNVLITKFEKLFRKHEIVLPNKIFEQEMDPNIDTCIMTPLELLFESLGYFDLQKGYLEGVGHWDIWLQRKINSQNKEQETKGLVGQKKKLNKKKLRKDKEIEKPEGFDYEPFQISLNKFIHSNLQTRQKLCEFFEQNKKQIMQLFVKENFELKSFRDINFDELFEFIINTLQLKINQEELELFPYILICFGGLEYDELQVQVIDKRNKNNKKVQNKIIKKISFEEIYKAIDIIKELNYLIVKKDQFIEIINNKYNSKIENQKMDIMTSLNNKKYPQILENFDNLQNIFLNIPEKLQNAICLNLFFIDKKYENYSISFLSHVFDYFLKREYFISSCPYKSIEIPLLKNFQLISQKNNSNFSHSMYFYHRIRLLEKNIVLKELSFHQKKLIYNQYNTQIDWNKRDNYYEILIQKSEHQKINLGYITLRQTYDLDYLKQNYNISELMMINSYKQKDVYELIFLKLHCFFENFKQEIIKIAMIKSQAKILIIDYDISQNLKISKFFINLKPKSQQTLTKQQTFSKRIQILRFQSLKYPKENINLRIYIIGASKSAIGVLNKFLNNEKFHFKNLNLVSNSFDWKKNLIDSKTNENDFDEDIFHLIESEVNLIHGTLIHLNRKCQQIITKSIEGQEVKFEYDLLILCNSLQEQTIKNLMIKKKEEQLQVPEFFININHMNQDIQQMCNSIALSYKKKLKSIYFNLPNYDCFFKQKEVSKIQEKQFINFLNENPNRLFFKNEDLQQWKNIIKFEKNWFSKILHPIYPKSLVFYGFSIELFNALYSFITKWNLNPYKITILIPDEPQFQQDFNDLTFEELNDLQDENIDYPKSFETQELWEFYEKKLIQLGITILKNYEIIDFNSQEMTIRNKNLIQEKQNEKNKAKFGQTINKQDSLENDNEIISNVIVIFSNCFDISDEIFNTIQDNGLVYNGRLIVQSNFKTIDDNIYAAGKICEFSQRYKNSSFGRSLRMDRYNQFEVGEIFAENFLKNLNSEEFDEEELPQFNKPISFSTRLFPDYYYILIQYPYEGKLEQNIPLNFKTCNQLQDDKDYFSFGFNQDQILKKIIYFGKQQLNLRVLENFMGFHLNYFQHMFKRYEEKHIDNYLDYLNLPWAEILMHPYFPKFRKVCDLLLQKYNKSLITLQNMIDIKNNELPQDIQELIENEVVIFLKDNKEHFKNYFFKQIQIKNYYQKNINKNEKQNCQIKQFILNIH